MSKFIQNAILLLIVFGGTWIWQYTKYIHGYGLFYRISPKYGLQLLTVTVLLSIPVCFYWANMSGRSKDKRKEKKDQEKGPD